MKLKMPTDYIEKCETWIFSDIVKIQTDPKQYI